MKVEKRKFSLDRLYRLARGILLAGAILIALIAVGKIVQYYFYKCPQLISDYISTKKAFEENVEAFCKKYDFKGKWGDNGIDLEDGVRHYKGDYKTEDCVVAYEKQETLEAVPYYGDPPVGITEKIWNPPNFRGMKGVRIVGEPRKAVTVSNYPSMCNNLDPKLNVKILLAAFLPFVSLVVLKKMVLYVFPKSS